MTFCRVLPMAAATSARRGSAALIRPVQSVVGGVGVDVARLLAEPSFAAAATRWAGRFAEVDGPRAAADRIVALHAAARTWTPQR